MAEDLPEALDTELRTLTDAQLSLSLPLHVLLGEAVDVARFAGRYWAAEREPGTDRILRPGLELAGSKLDPEIIPHILTLQAATQEAQTAFLLALASPRGNATVVRARFVLGEITATLEWLFDDGIEDERDRQLQNLTEAHRETPDSQDALASELDDFAALAAQNREQLAEIGAFDMTLIEEGRALAQALRERSATAATPAEVRSLLDRRTRLAGLLQTKMNHLRAAARFVFRHHPEIVREVTSTYERHRRAQSRRRTATPPEGTPSSAQSKIAP